ncbi:hypothetical protein JI747_001355 [Chryseobacterium sp. RG1]|uniref:Uncharacterized protein n=1 Tax=Chryseobacterium tagetis TaxID=2801334 RepID=A0ABS7ZVP4_9FLAO|nr:hypothetical protein [Chryseobacterium tagetis]MCA6065804.1 hypothetical protein [Chryseobacterium tagetis]
MMIISKGPKIKCKRCQKQYDIDPVDFDDADISSDERSMGYELQYTWQYMSNCVRCKNELTIIVEGYEYPVGAFNYEEFTYEGCIVIENPELEIKHIEEYEDDDIY